MQRRGQAKSRPSWCWVVVVNCQLGGRRDEGQSGFILVFVEAVLVRQWFESRRLFCSQRSWVRCRAPSPAPAAPLAFSAPVDQDFDVLLIPRCRNAPERFCARSGGAVLLESGAGYRSLRSQWWPQKIPKRVLTCSDWVCCKRLVRSASSTASLCAFQSGVMMRRYSQFRRRRQSPVCLVPCASDRRAKVLGETRPCARRSKPSPRSLKITSWQPLSDGAAPKERQTLRTPDPALCVQSDGGGNTARRVSFTACVLQVIGDCRSGANQSRGPTASRPLLRRPALHRWRSPAPGKRIDRLPPEDFCFARVARSKKIRSR